ncbi:MAG: Rrf2 family transcriptional regulator [Bacteroidales bacterium]|nr:Rrf2 family transcriptional regulator [Bacteroidales bacterium]MBK7173359.1 Rrf2 family transcriptional regulator [Bacteroidales bacterium]
MLSQKTRYAMLALTYLAKEVGKGAIMISEIAKAENIPQRYLEAILLDLKKLGMLGSKLGKNGGYYMIRKPEDIDLSQVVRHFEGPIALVPCVSEKAYQPCEFCKDETTCNLKRVFKDIRDYTYEKLAQTSISDLIRMDSLKDGK